MKSRPGFVSNSSSSSFILGLNDPKCNLLKELEDCYDLYVAEISVFSESGIKDVTKQWKKFQDYDYKYLYKIEVDYNDSELCESIRYVFNKETGKNIETSIEGDGFKIIEGWY